MLGKRQREEVRCRRACVRLGADIINLINEMVLELHLLDWKEDLWFVHYNFGLRMFEASQNRKHRLNLPGDRLMRYALRLKCITNRELVGSLYWLSNYVAPFCTRGVVVFGHGTKE